MSEPTDQPDPAPAADPPPCPDVKAITAALAAPFDLREVKFKPQSVKANRCLAIAYVDVRVIQDRLDGVLGVEGWQDWYELLPDGSVVCKLSLTLGGRDVSKMDVGSPSEQPDGGDRLKAAFSDALKRAAVKFGIGRYLYRLPAQWVDYDPQKKQITGTPQLPGFAIPKTSGAAPQQTAKAGTAPAPQQQPAADPPPFESGQDMSDRVHAWDEGLAKSKKIKAGELIAWAKFLLTQGGYKKDNEDNPDALAFAFEGVRWFIQAVKSGKRPPHARDVANNLAEQFQAQLETNGRRHFGVKWADWLSDQGVPAADALNKMNHQSLAKIASDLNTQVEFEQKEREAIQGAKG